jgi:hypothetical protein
MSRPNFVVRAFLLLLLIGFFLSFLFIPIDKPQSQSFYQKDSELNANADGFYSNLRLNVSLLCSVWGRVDYGGSSSLADERNLLKLKDNAYIRFREGSNDDFWVTLIFWSSIIWNTLNNFSIFSRGYASNSQEELEVYIWNYTSGSWNYLNFVICDSTSYANETKFVQGSSHYWRTDCQKNEMKIRLYNTENHDGSNSFYVDQFCLYLNTTKDNAPPVITNFKITPSSPFTNQSITFNATVIDSSSGVKKVTYGFEGAIGLPNNVTFYMDALKSGNFYYAFDRLVGGNYTVSIVAEDYAGNTATQKKSLKVNSLTCPTLPPPTLIKPARLNVLANDTYLQVNDWTQITIICENGTCNVSRLWYHDPFLDINVTLAVNITGNNEYYLNFTSSIAGLYQFDVWANMSCGDIGKIYDWVMVNWTAEPPPCIAPIVNILANDTYLYTNEWTMIAVFVIIGSCNITELIVYDPISDSNITVDTDIDRDRMYLLNFTTDTAGMYLFGLFAYINCCCYNLLIDFLIVQWVSPPSPPAPSVTAPSLMVLANDTYLEVDQYTQIRIICVNGTSNVSRLWYRDPFTFNNITLATNFNGTQLYLVNFTTNSAGIRYFHVWAEGYDNGSAYDYVIVEWYPLYEFLWNLTVSTYNIKGYLKDTTLHLYRVDIPKTLVAEGKTVGGDYEFINLSSLYKYQVEAWYMGFKVGVWGEVQSKNPRWIQINCSIIDVTVHLEWTTGVPIRGVSVLLYLNQTFYLSGTTNDSGEFTFSQVPATTHFIKILLEEEELTYILENEGYIERRITYAIVPTGGGGGVVIENILIIFLVVSVIALLGIVGYLYWQLRQTPKTKIKIVHSGKEREEEWLKE